MVRFFLRLIGKAIRGFAKVHSLVLDGLVYVIETGVLLAKSFLKGCLIIIGMGGCLVLFLLMGPVGAWLLSNPGVLLIMLFILIFPLLGAVFVSFLKYFQTVSSQYLQNLASYLQYPDRFKYRPYRYFKQAFRRAEEEAARREQARREQQQREWEERFRQWHQYQGQHWQQGYQGQRSYSTASNPYVDFKRKYEKSCTILGVPVNADQYKIKLAYRRQAKLHHPDLNKDPGATRKFQEINDAYEFLNEDNIRRYRNLGS